MAGRMSPDLAPGLPETADPGAHAGRRRILIVGTDESSLLASREALLQVSHATTWALLHARVASAVRAARPELVILDLPLGSVLPVVRLARILPACGMPGPRLLVLSAVPGEQGTVSALDAGADDYIVKPCSTAELMARVRALLRSRLPDEWAGETLRFQELQIRSDDRRLTVHGTPVALRSSEYRLLEFLLRHPERAFSRAQLLEQTCGRVGTREDRGIDVTIQRLRKALARHGCSGYIQTIRRVGYRLSATVEPAPKTM